MKLRFRAAVAGVLAAGVLGVMAGTALSAEAATPAATATRTYWQQDDGVGAVVTTTFPSGKTVVANGNSFEGGKPGPDSFAAYLQAGSGQWVYGPDKAYAPSGYPNPAVPSTKGLTRVWSGKVDGYPVTLYAGKSPYSAASQLEAWLKS